MRNERGRREVTQAMGLAVRKTQDAVLLDRCAQQTALAVGASAEAVRAEFQRIPQPKARLGYDPPEPMLTEHLRPNQRLRHRHSRNNGCCGWPFRIQRLEIGRPIVWIRAGWSIRRCAPFWKRRRKLGIQPKCW